MSNDLILSQNYSLEKSNKYLTHLTKTLENSESRLIPFRHKKLWGYCNLDGEVKIPCEFDEAWEFDGNHAMIVVNNKCGIINKYGKIVIPCSYQFVTSLGEGYWCGHVNNESFAILNPQHELICNVSGYDPFVEGFAIVKRKTSKLETGFLDTKGNINWIKYKFATHFHEGLSLCLNENDLFGYLGRDFNVVIPFQYKNASSFREGLAGVSISGTKYGYVNKHGNILIPMLYDKIGSFCEGLAMVKVNGKYGYIDIFGKSVIQSSFDEATDFFYSHASVGKLGRDGVLYFGIIDINGKMIIDYQYDSIIPIEFSGLLVAAVESKGSRFYIDMENNIISEEEINKHQGQGGIYKVFYEGGTGVNRRLKGYANLNGLNYWID